MRTEELVRLEPGDGYDPFTSQRMAMAIEITQVPSGSEVLSQSSIGKFKQNVHFYSSLRTMQTDVQYGLDIHLPIFADANIGVHSMDSSSHLELFCVIDVLYEDTLEYITPGASVSLSVEALNLLGDGDSSQFAATYGRHMIETVTHGRRGEIILHFHAIDKEHSQAITAALNAKLFNGGGKINFSREVKEVLQQTEVAIYYSTDALSGSPFQLKAGVQKGKEIENFSATLTEMLEALDCSPEKNKLAVPMSYISKPYNHPALQLRPREALDHISAATNTLDSLRNKIDQGLRMVERYLDTLHAVNGDLGFEEQKNQHRDFLGAPDERIEQIIKLHVIQYRLTELRASSERTPPAKIIVQIGRELEILLDKINKIPDIFTEDDRANPVPLATVLRDKITDKKHTQRSSNTFSLPKRVGLENVMFQFLTKAQKQGNIDRWNSWIQKKIFHHADKRAQIVSRFRDAQVRGDLNGEKARILQRLHYTQAKVEMLRSLYVGPKNPHMTHAVENVIPDITKLLRKLVRPDGGLDSALSISHIIHRSMHNMQRSESLRDLRGMELTDDNAQVLPVLFDYLQQTLRCIRNALDGFITPGPWIPQQDSSVVRVLHKRFGDKNNFAVFEQLAQDAEVNGYNSNEGLIARIYIPLSELRNEAHGLAESLDFKSNEGFFSNFFVQENVGLTSPYEAAKKRLRAFHHKLTDVLEKIKSQLAYNYPQTRAVDGDLKNHMKKVLSQLKKMINGIFHNYDVSVLEKVEGLMTHLRRRLSVHGTQDTRRSARSRGGFQDLRIMDSAASTSTAVSGSSARVTPLTSGDSLIVRGVTPLPPFGGGSSLAVPSSNGENGPSPNSTLSAVQAARPSPVDQVEVAPEPSPEQVRFKQLLRTSNCCRRKWVGECAVNPNAHGLVEEKHIYSGVELQPGGTYYLKPAEEKTISADIVSIGIFAQRQLHRPAGEVGDIKPSDALLVKKMVKEISSLPSP